MPSVAFLPLASLVVAAAFSSPADAIELEPHRAVYSISLDSSKPTTRVNGAQGKLVYELQGNACAGYSVQLRQSTDLHTEGGSVSSAVSTATWEDGEGNAYRFRITNALNGEKPDEADGVAERKDGRLVVKATKPETDTIQLGNGVMLPTQHVLRVLEKARSGEALLEAAVFDGSPDARKVYDTLAVIGKGATGARSLEGSVKESELVDLTYYPVTISYYERGTSSETPDYVISFNLFENGVSGALRLDYGEFALKGTLTSYEALPQEECAK